MKRPAILNGPPSFPQGQPFARPAVPPLERVMARLAPSYEQGMLTHGPLARELEEVVANRLGARHVVALSSCTTGLLLALKVLGVKGRAVLPSFTFSATGHALLWNGVRPVFAECDPNSFQIDVADAESRLEGASAIMATHIFGAPCDTDALEALAAQRNIPLIFDAAHGFGATRQGRPVGTCGTVEIFSLTPTKPLVAGEGGLLVTDDDDLAYGVRIGRDYANPGDYNTQFAGLNGRMSELHAAVALESLEAFDENLELRRAVAKAYTARLDEVPGIRTQVIADGDLSTFKDFTVAVDEDMFGVSRDLTVRALAAEGIDTRNYFSPPLHQQQAYDEFGPVSLPVTEAVARSVVSLLMAHDLSEGTIARVVDALAAIHAHAEEVVAAI